MKKLIAILAVALLGFTSAANAQKYGHINAQELLIAVPGYEDSNKEMERYRDSKISELKDIKTTVQKRYTEYLGTKETLSKTIQGSREKEITELQNAAIEFEQGLQAKIQAKQQELMGPLLNQLQDAIKVVGKDNGYSYIFDITQGTVVYFDGGNDVTPLVIAELKKVVTLTPIK
tara:strand:- start:1110 stop:1634 length:525 start_codon:yes stop_codon:yes gene_type:complete